MQSDPDLLGLILKLDVVGMIVAALLIGVFAYSKVASGAAKVLAIGSAAAPWVGGYFAIISVSDVPWDAIVATAGGYVLFSLALIQYYHDRKLLESHD